MVLSSCSYFLCLQERFKVNESRYKQCDVNSHFSTGQNILKRILKKDKYWQSIEKSFLIDPLATNNALRRDLLIFDVIIVVHLIWVAA